MKTSHALLVIGALAVAVYANSLQNDFVWDDDYLITNNLHVQAPSVKHALFFFKDNLGKHGQDVSNFYRPLQELSYMIDYAIWKLNPVGFHLVNLLLHAAVTFLLFLVTRHIAGDRAIAIVSALIYMVHPLHVEAVTYIAGRADSLVSLFLLLSFYLYILHREMSPGEKRNLYLLLSSASFACALLSKEIAMVLPFVLIFYDMTFKVTSRNFYNSGTPPGVWRKRMLRLAPYLSIFVVYIVLRTTVLDFGHPVASFPEGIGFHERLLTSFKVFAEYLRLIVLPFDLHMERKLIFSKSFIEPAVLISCAILAICITLTFLLRKRHTLAFFGLGWFFITVFPSSNVPFALNAIMAEHWLYIPLMGIAMVAGLIVVSGARAISSRKSVHSAVASVVTAGIVAYFSILTVKQNTVWRDNETLYRHTLRYTRNDPRLHYNLGNILKASGRLVEAAQEYKTAIGLDPSWCSPHYNLGLMYAGIGDIDRALAEFCKSAALEPKHYKSYCAMGVAYKHKGMPDKAIECFLKALEVNPEYTDALNNIKQITTREEKQGNDT